MLDKNTLVVCPWCGHSNTIEKWNSGTYLQCTNREMKRDFIQMTNEKAFKRNSKSFYMCPSCSKWTRGNQLSIVTNNNKNVERLGGEPLIKAINNSNT